MGNTRLWVPVESKPFDRSTWNLTWVITSAVWLDTPKIVKIGYAGQPRHMGEMSCSNVFYLFYIFCWLLAQLWRTHFWEYRHRFCVKRRGSVRIDILGGHNFNTKIFPHTNPQKPQILDSFLDRKLSAKTLYNGEAHKQTALNCHRSPLKIAKWIGNMGSGIPNMWLFVTPLPWVTWYGECALRQKCFIIRRLISKLPLIVTAAPWKLQSE